MLKKLFNQAVQSGTDVYYGVMLNSMSGQRKLRLNGLAALGASLGVMGAVSGDMSALVLSAGTLGVTALAFGEAGARLRHGAVTPQP